MKWIFFTPLKKPIYSNLFIAVAHTGDALVRLLSFGFLATRWSLWAHGWCVKKHIARLRAQHDQRKQMGQ